MADNGPQDKPFDDVRMRGFARRSTVAQVLKWLDKRLAPLPPERVSLSSAAGRVLAADVQSQVDVPLFARSMMDGYAVRAEDTLGASLYNRLPIALIGEALPGRQASGQVEPGKGMKIMTGAPLPPGADSVIPAEKVDVEGNRILALDEVSPGKNVGPRGEDIVAGATVLFAGRMLRPQDLGVLSSIGEATISVVRRPNVRIIVTGNELLPAGSRPCGSCISDANSVMLAALVERDGGCPILPGIVSDDPDAILDALRGEADILVVSGGSSVGMEDYAPAIVAQQGDLAIHGIAMRPSSPTGLGTFGGRLVFLLPGNPVSCLCAYDFFAGRATRVLGGRGQEWPYRSTSLPLRRKLVSSVGRLDYARVGIVDGQVEPLSVTGASVLSSTTRADGFVVVPDDSEGYAAGSLVTVYLYDRP